MSNKSDKEQTEECIPWVRPSEVMALHRLRKKKKALQVRMSRSFASNAAHNSNLNVSSVDILSSKRKNPFVKNDENKKPKTDIANIESELSESTDNTLFKLLHPNTSVNLKIPSSPFTSFTSAFNKIQNNSTSILPVTNQGEKWIPIDWTLKRKLKLMSSKPFAWTKTLKTNEEASGITGYVRCLDTKSSTSLDTSPNAQFHQCCLYWQHPSLPWLQLFPRSQGKVSATVTNFSSSAVKDNLRAAWSNSVRSLFQLVRTRQCPYFYVCANTFTACFRAAGICGHSEMHVLLTPTTRGFRELLRKEDIEFTMPLKNKRRSFDGSVDQGYDTLDSTGQNINDDSQTFGKDLSPDDEDDGPNEQWLSSLGVNAEEIKKINYQQAKINHRLECEIDNSEQSLVFVSGVEAHGLYNFLINCKSIIPSTGPLAGVPPTLLAPVAFHGASLQALSVQENKVMYNESQYYCIELSGPILPHTLHNLYSLLPKDTSITATFADILSTAPFSKVKAVQNSEDEKLKEQSKKIEGCVIFEEENLSDCGLNKEILKHFCTRNPDCIQHYDSVKYSSDSGLYVWL